MDSEGNIRTVMGEVEKAARAKQEGHRMELANAEELLQGQELLPIPPEELERVKRMNRAQRKGWYRARRKKLKLAAIRVARAKREARRGV